MMNWETRKMLRCGRMREVCIFGLGSTFNVATNFFLNILFFFPSVSFVSCMEKSKILFITMYHLITFMWQMLPSQEVNPRKE